MLSAFFHVTQFQGLKSVSARYGLIERNHGIVEWIDEDVRKMTDKQKREMMRSKRRDRIDMIADLALWLTNCLRSERIANNITAARDK